MSGGLIAVLSTEHGWQSQKFRYARSTSSDSLAERTAQSADFLLACFARRPPETDPSRRGCVVPRGIAASYEPARLQWQRFGPALPLSGQTARLQIFRCENGPERLVSELESTVGHAQPSRPGKPSDFAWLVWPAAAKLPEGTYLARLQQPVAGAELRFTLSHATAR